MRTQREVVVLLARETRQIEDNHELNFAFVYPAELQEFLKLGPIRGLRALAFFSKSSQYFEALPLAVLFARFELSRQTEVFCLSFRADADVDDSANHRSQLRLVHSEWQAVRKHHYSSLDRFRRK